jgi:hypothetical protein
VSPNEYYVNSFILVTAYKTTTYKDSYFSKKISHSYSTFAGFGGRYLTIFGIREVEKWVKRGVKRDKSQL